MPVHTPTACSEARDDADLRLAFGLLGKPWTGVVLGRLGDGEMGFAELGRAVEGISQSVLSDRLTSLAGVGLITREVAPGPPVAVTYALTDDGRALLPALESLAQWARAHLDPARCAAAGH